MCNLAGGLIVQAHAHAQERKRAIYDSWPPFRNFEGLPVAESSSTTVPAQTDGDHFNIRARREPADCLNGSDTFTDAVISGPTAEERS